jgi:hypothetical protein
MSHADMRRWLTMRRWVRAGEDAAHVSSRPGKAGSMPTGRHIEYTIGHRAVGRNVTVVVKPNR